MICPQNPRSRKSKIIDHFHKLKYHSSPFHFLSNVGYGFHTLKSFRLFLSCQAKSIFISVCLLCKWLYFGPSKMLPAGIFLTAGNWSSHNVFRYPISLSFSSTCFLRAASSSLSCIITMSLSPDCLPIFSLTTFNSSFSFLNLSISDRAFVICSWWTSDRVRD